MPTTRRLIGRLAMSVWDEGADAEEPTPACPGLEPGPFQAKVGDWNGPGSPARSRASSSRLWPGQTSLEPTEIACICIDPRFVDRVWPHVYHLIRLAMERGR